MSCCVSCKKRKSVKTGMSAKSDTKYSSDYSEKQQQHSFASSSALEDSTSSYKRNKINTSEKLQKKDQQQHQRKSEEKYLDDDNECDSKMIYSAESKNDKRQRSSTEGGTPKGKSTFTRKEKFNESLDEIEEADREFENLMRRPNEGTIEMPSNPAARLIMNGFQINLMRMRDANTGRLLWSSRRWTPQDMLDDVMEARIPKEILDCDAVTREINFSSQEQIQNFRLVQRIFVHGTCLEEWAFQFGFVIPGSTNSWEQTIYAAPRNKMIPAEVLSGNTTIETSFYDGNQLIAKTLLRLYYD